MVMSASVPASDGVSGVVAASSIGKTRCRIVPSPTTFAKRDGTGNLVTCAIPQFPGAQSLGFRDVPHSRNAGFERFGRAPANAALTNASCSGVPGGGSFCISASTQPGKSRASRSCPAKPESSRCVWALIKPGTSTPRLRSRATGSSPNCRRRSASSPTLRILPFRDNDASSANTGGTFRVHGNNRIRRNQVRIRQSFVDLTHGGTVMPRFARPQENAHPAQHKVVVSFNAVENRSSELPPHIMPEPQPLPVRRGRMSPFIGILEVPRYRRPQPLVPIGKRRPPALRQHPREVLDQCLHPPHHLYACRPIAAGFIRAASQETIVPRRMGISTRAPPAVSQ